MGLFSSGPKLELDWERIEQKSCGHASKHASKGHSLFQGALSQDACASIRSLKFRNQPFVQ